jgi:hypothetical protein
MSKVLACTQQQVFGRNRPVKNFLQISQESQSNWWKQEGIHCLGDMRTHEAGQSSSTSEFRDSDLTNGPSLQLFPCSALSLMAIFIYLFIYFAVLGLEIRAYTLSHSTIPFYCDGFF